MEENFVIIFLESMLLNFLKIEVSIFVIDVRCFLNLDNKMLFENRNFLFLLKLFLEVVFLKEINFKEGKNYVCLFYGVEYENCLLNECEEELFLEK